MENEQLTYEGYLATLPEDRRMEIDRVWKVVRRSVGAGFTEEIGPKFLTLKADGEWFCGLADQKNYISLHMIPIYVRPELKAKIYNAGKKLKGGKGCINFCKADELPLETIGEVLGSFTADSFKSCMKGIRETAQQERKQRAKA
jgi:hypothetical protein